jgi:hypothetical protein
MTLVMPHSSIESCLPSWPHDCNDAWIKIHILVNIGSNQFL